MIMMLGHILGGVGIFLLAISMLTQGLQMISGKALKTLLARWTRTPLRGLTLGIAATAILQSSSVMTAALIGLVNAALLPLGQAIWVVLGTNIGTTFTGWLVSTVGFELNLKAYALPMVGIGMMLKLFGRKTAYIALGMALAGLGLFFIGVDILKDAFSAYSDAEDFTRIEHTGIAGMVLMLLAGFAITVVTQSSSASLALILTSTAGGMITLESGAIMVIGANLGTTSTAVLAVIGATANAKRTAGAHVLFNLVAAVAALVALPVLLPAIALGGEWLNMALPPVVMLAVFHTLFNILGVVVIAPFVPAMTRFLERRFVSQAEEIGRPKYLDRNTLHVPALAMGALTHELGHLHGLIRNILALALQSPSRHEDRRRITHLRDGMENLSTEITGFSDELTRKPSPQDVAQMLPSVLRINRYLRECVQLLPHSVALEEAIEDKDEALTYVRHCRKFLDKLQATLNARESAASPHILTGLRNQYRRAKDAVLEDGARHKLSVEEMDELLGHLHHVHRLAAQTIKAERHLAALERMQQVQKGDQNEQAKEPA